MDILRPQVGQAHPFHNFGIDLVCQHYRMPGLATPVDFISAAGTLFPIDHVAVVRSGPGAMR